MKIDFRRSRQVLAVVDLSSEWPLFYFTAPRLFVPRGGFIVANNDIIYIVYENIHLSIILLVYFTSLLFCHLLYVRNANKMLSVTNLPDFQDDLVLFSFHFHVFAQNVSPFITQDILKFAHSVICYINTVSLRESALSQSHDSTTCNKHKSYV